MTELAPAAALVRWHDEWQPTLSAAGMTVALTASGTEPPEAAQVTMSRDGRTARLFVLNGSPHEVDVDLDARVGLSALDMSADADSARLAGRLAAWVLDDPDVNL